MMQRTQGPLSDDLLQRIRERALKEAELLDALEDATRAGDCVRAWGVSQELLKLADEARVVRE